jgi:hypothetical protein
MRKVVRESTDDISYALFDGAPRKRGSADYWGYAIEVEGDDNAGVVMFIPGISLSDLEDEEDF